MYTQLMMIVVIMIRTIIMPSESKRTWYLTNQEHGLYQPERLLAVARADRPKRYESITQWRLLWRTGVTRHLLHHRIIEAGNRRKNTIYPSLTKICNILIGINHHPTTIENMLEENTACPTDWVQHWALRGLQRISCDWSPWQQSCRSLAWYIL